MSRRPPVAPIGLRLACLEAAQHQIAAERALLNPWSSVRLAPIPPGARWQGAADPFPQLYPLGSWGNLLAELRQDIDTLLALAAAPDDRLWTQRDSQSADTQHAEGWRQAVALDTAAREAASRRLVALGTAAQVAEAWHRLLDFSGDELHPEVLASLRSLTHELLTLGRAPSHDPQSSEGFSTLGCASPSQSAARSGALPFPGSGPSVPSPEPGSFSPDTSEARHLGGQPNEEQEH